MCGIIAASNSQLHFIRHNTTLGKIIVSYNYHKPKLYNTIRQTDTHRCYNPNQSVRQATRHMDRTWHTVLYIGIIVAF